MKMSVTHQYLIDLANILSRPELVFAGQVPGSLGYKISMNLKTAKIYQDGFIQAFPMDPKWEEYVVRHNKLFSEANVRTDADLGNLPEAERAELMKKSVDLDEEYKDTREKERATEMERQKLLAEKVEVDLYTVTPDEITLKDPDGWRIWPVMVSPIFWISALISAVMSAGSAKVYRPEVVLLPSSPLNSSVAS